VEYVQKLLDEIGLNGRCIQMINLSAAMAGQFAWAAAQMTAEIKSIGPNPLGEEQAPSVSFLIGDGRGCVANG
jgi:coenzyme F420-reducing hydrogenase delta subunit